MSSRAPFAVAVALAACALVAACGGSSGGPSAAAKEHAAQTDAETKLAEYARCLREHGVEAQATSHPGGGPALAVGPTTSAGGPVVMEVAQQACARYRAEEAGTGNPSPQQRVQEEERGLRFGKCMREHGIKAEERVSGNSVRMLVGGRQPNAESPAFQRAMSVCGGPKG